ncbi:hypothetical protein [Draconibacterium sediminis]|uniref:Uncharacterized protein n=1 Tax=Draconibacterium sediminis TaxID=1544798 RepID=A0A0D8JBC9_9BACT|nr:hypothetical protein [Draconibacterium sediminis]KJF44280.1 hypothetical protein LH29_01835 [Draconibacterium sediminis]
MCEFYHIREFACAHFYIWETGDDFDWLRKEWNKFEPRLKTRTEAEDFILVLADLYEGFCSESYFLKPTYELMKEFPFIVEDPNPEKEDPEIRKRIETFRDQTLNILYEVYESSEEILRNFVSVAIDFEVPHPDGYVYVQELFSELETKKDIEKGAF